MAFEPHYVRGWRAWVAAAGLVVAWYGLFVVFGWMSASGPTGGNLLAEEQPVEDWLLPLGIASGLAGAAAIWVAWRTAPRYTDTPVGEPSKWFIPVALVTMAVVALLGLGTALLGSPDSAIRGTPLGILPLLAAAGYFAWRRAQKSGGL
jgi:hypothetical protein